MKGIDISFWQSQIDWQKVRESGVEFVLLRACYGLWKDKMFDTHINGALAAGLNVGAYCFSIAENTEMAREEAHAMLAIVKPYQLTMPIMYDAENENGKGLGLISTQERTDCCIAFCEEIEKAGYYAMIYANKTWLETKLDYEQLKRFDVWLAEWGKKPTWAGKYGIWQSGINNVPGAGNVDYDIAYKDYPSIIKAAGLNGFTKPTVAPLVETKQEPVQAPPTEAPKVTYTVKPGDSFCGISSKLFGDEAYADDIAAANGKKITSVIHPGDVLIIPDVAKAMPIKINPGTQTTTNVSQKIVKGDKVTVVKPIEYKTNKTFKVYYPSYDVMELSGERAVIGVQDVVTAAIDVKYLAKL